MKWVFLLMTIYFQNVQAFTLNNSVAASFNVDHELAVNMASNTDCSATGLTNDEILSLAVDGIEQFWNQVATSSLRLKKGSLISVSTAFETDNICTSGANANCVPNPTMKVENNILIACNTTSTNFSNNSYVMAVALPNNIEESTIKGALVLINSSGSTATNVFGNRERHEQVSILAHELGHAVGLGHSAVKDSLMYFESIDKRSAVGWDDVLGITYLYPQEQPFSCSSIANDSNEIGPGWVIFLLSFFMTLLLTKVVRSGIR